MRPFFLTPTSGTVGMCVNYYFVRNRGGDGAIGSQALDLDSAMLWQAAPSITSIVNLGTKWANSEAK